MALHARPGGETGLANRMQGAASSSEKQPLGYLLARALLLSALMRCERGDLESAAGQLKSTERPYRFCPRRKSCRAIPLSSVDRPYDHSGPAVSKSKPASSKCGARGKRL